MAQEIGFGITCGKTPNQFDPVAHHNQQISKENVLHAQLPISIQPYRQSLHAVLGLPNHREIATALESVLTDLCRSAFQHCYNYRNKNCD